MPGSDRPRPAPEETKLVICVWHPFSEWRPKPSMAAAVGERWPAMKVVHLPNYERLPEELPDAKIFVGYSLRPEQLRHARALRWIHSTATGVAQLLYPELTGSGIAVTNASGLFSVPMAEHTIGLLLALARNFPDSVRYQDAGKWSVQDLWDRPQRLQEINGRLLLIVGYGSIGRELAKRARAFDLRVWGVTRGGSGDRTHAERILPVSDLDQALAEADYVVLAAPETPETSRLMNAERIARMKRGARLVNIARGSLVDEPALITALEEGRLAGAALDVAGKEPLPPDSPLWRAPNLLLTPHTSAVSERLWERETALLLRLLEEWFSGRELSNRVDFARGY